MSSSLRSDSSTLTNTLLVSVPGIQGFQRFNLLVFHMLSLPLLLDGIQ